MVKDYEKYFLDIEGSCTYELTKIWGNNNHTKVTLNSSKIIESGHIIPPTEELQDIESCYERRECSLQYYCALYVGELFLILRPGMDSWYIQFQSIRENWFSLSQSTRKRSNCPQFKNPIKTLNSLIFGKKN